MRIGARAMAAVAVAFLVLPPLSLVLTLEADDLSGALDAGMGAALRLSLSTTALTVCLLLVFGTPLAWWLGRRDDRFGRIVEAAARLPAVTPPAVAGVALLAAFGSQGVFNPVSSVRIAFTLAAVVIAQVFVAMPFYVLPLADAFRALDEELLWTARSLGASPARVFFRIALPLVSPVLLSGLAMAWARALGEFGATLMFAGNLPGVTQTLPVAIYASMEGDLGPARAMAIVLLVVAMLVFWALRAAPLDWLLGKRRSR